ncbi:30S ribosomal protein S1 [Lactobacillus kefiranofaciens]|uniref:30S ribosomal protein S1 n=1 Tax=Lactobacillus kefiranofaciens TaxID=267818 RepID=A0AAX3UFM5_9LACO|nr:30S ribosomal protein S1 [Lactobacillus kefiranofaciens]AEG40396.1 30S ribosomal protein S1 [Lactobacillus kefiranofaciens subsp. kefiranofaciens]KRM22129.1 30S ribosomal protein S1 [Lactobacillus kefiranofaciens subsp. kefiranofaciens DSM 5016 = JCM 6985]QFQ67936.1 30S ribosomal protein S1 [Lactobacillus kefiranofaciens subsp. kefiranofaciens]WGO86290.1 30S ribosomal protein S1 [Lactobacillus kefiranofaciens]WQH36390.1 30S ribosomal protein S1 [Lactobacillus kefiranofaciens]
MSENSNQFLDALKQMQGVEVGDIVDVEVLDVEDGQIDVGVENAGVEGVITRREYTSDRNADLRDLVKPGDKFKALVLRRAGGDKENGEFFFSVTRLKEREAYDKLQKDYEEGNAIEGTVTSSVRGGLLVDVGTRGFLPASLISNRYVSDLKPYIGKTMKLKITEIDPNKNRLILSHKDLVEEEREEAFDKVASQLVVGDVIEGKVSRLTNFGAFVDVGGVDGLVHISEISYKHVDKPSDVLKAGQEVKVKVIGIDNDRHRISLSIKQIEPSPFEQATANLNEGDVFEGEVKSLTNFGAFVEVADGIQGLVHVSEISNKHVDKPSDVLKVGQEVKVKVLNIDPSDKRISLSIKAADPNASSSDNYSSRPRRSRNKNSVNKKYMGDNDNGFALGDIIGDQLKDRK